MSLQIGARAFLARGLEDLVGGPVLNYLAHGHEDDGIRHTALLDLLSQAGVFEVEQDLLQEFGRDLLAFRNHFGLRRWGLVVSAG